MARQVIPNAGNWSTLAALINANFLELYEYRYLGLYNYTDLTTQTTPINLTASTWTDLTNDGAAPFSSTHPVVNKANIWDTGNQRFDWSGLAIGDSVRLVILLKVTTTVNNQSVNMRVQLGIGGTPFELPIGNDVTYKSAGEYQFATFTSIQFPDTNTLNNFGKLQLFTDNTGSVKVDGWFCTVSKAAIEAT